MASENQVQSFADAFLAFSKFGNTKSDGTTILLSQSDKWMKQAAVFGKKLSTTDTAIAFNKHKSKSLNFKTFEKFVEDLCTTKKIDLEEFKGKLVNCGPPGTSKTTKAVDSGAVQRLTDTSKYTGAHKERFDESGKGKGKGGREELVDDSGYVGGYKEKDTYDETH